jgi:hypothetical protein
MRLRLEATTAAAAAAATHVAPRVPEQRKTSELEWALTEIADYQ